MYRVSLKHIISAFLLVLGFSLPAYACSCLNPGPPCQAYWKSQAVFVGTPLSASIVEVDWQGHKLPRRLYRFAVEEAFRGVEAKEIEVLTGAGGGDCGYDFEKGIKYLVYGSKVQGKPWIGTSICSATKPLSEATEDISFIRSIPGLPQGGEIFGSAHRYSVNLETGGQDLAAPIVSAKVTISSGVRRVEAVTGADGGYRFSGLPPGKYSVRIELPPKLSPQEEQTVEVHDRGCARIDYRAVIDGRISGRLLDARGKGPGIVTVSLLLVGADPKDFRSLWAITESDGSFEFKELPPGQYVLGINVGDAPDEELPYRTTYYPSASEPGAARVLNLEEGQHISGVEFQLPPPLARRMITGTVVWPDGRTATNAEVSMTEVASDRPAGPDAKTDTKGRFSLKAYDGVRYKIRASVPADPNWDPDSGQPVQLLVSPEVEVTSGAQVKPIRLVIDVKGDGIIRTRSVLRAPSPTTRPKRRRKS